MLDQPPLWVILLAFVCAIGPLVFIHELGHFLVAKLFGVGAEVFSIGFGPEIFGWTDRSGTRWKVGWLPLGGYVRFIGDMNPASAPELGGEELPEELRARSFPYKPVWQRFLIVLAGPLANFLLAILIFAAFFAILGLPRTPNAIGTVQPGSAAASAGLKVGDRIDAVAGQRVDSFEDLQRIVALRPGERVEVSIERGGRQLSLQLTLSAHEEQDRFGQRFRIGMLGVMQSGRVMERLSPAELIPAATGYTIALTRSMIDGVAQIVTGRRSAKDLGGPLKIAQIAGQQASLGAFEFIQLLALFSINLGFINLLPVPMLDG
ncbi:MAG: M50 family metallopeptidase, partial [Sphingomicrobium sp.]